MFHATARSEYKLKNRLQFTKKNDFFIKIATKNCRCNEYKLSDGSAGAGSFTCTNISLCEYFAI